MHLALFCVLCIKYYQSAVVRQRFIRQAHNDVAVSFGKAFYFFTVRVKGRVAEENKSIPDAAGRAADKSAAVAVEPYIFRSNKQGVRAFFLCL